MCTSTNLVATGPLRWSVFAAMAACTLHAHSAASSDSSAARGLRVTTGVVRLRRTRRNDRPRPALGLNRRRRPTGVVVKRHRQTGGPATQDPLLACLPGSVERTYPRTCRISRTISRFAKGLIMGGMAAALHVRRSPCLTACSDEGLLRDSAILARLRNGAHPQGGPAGRCSGQREVRLLRAEPGRQQPIVSRSEPMRESAPARVRHFESNAPRLCPPAVKAAIAWAKGRNGHPKQDATNYPMTADSGGPAHAAQPHTARLRTKDRAWPASRPRPAERADRASTCLPAPGSVTTCRTRTVTTARRCGGHNMQRRHVTSERANRGT